MRHAALLILGPATFALAVLPARSGEAAPGPAQPPAAAQWVDLLSIMAELAPLKVTKAADGVSMTQEGDRGRYETRARLKPPFKLECVAKTDSTNVRFFFARGHYIFNWEINQKRLHVGSPADARVLPDQKDRGQVAPNEWHRFLWTVSPDGQTMAVDDRTVFEVKEDYSRTEGQLAVAAAWKSVVAIKSMRILTEDPANQKALADPAARKPDEKKPEEKKPEEKKPEEKRPDKKPDLFPNDEF
jgi:hypothetical protein